MQTILIPVVSLVAVSIVSLLAVSWNSRGFLRTVAVKIVCRIEALDAYYNAKKDAAPYWRRQLGVIEMPDKAARYKKKTLGVIGAEEVVL